MKNNAEKVRCKYCGKPGARQLYVTRTYGKGRELLIIENVPRESCSIKSKSYRNEGTKFWISEQRDYFVLP